MKHVKKTCLKGGTKADNKGGRKQGKGDGQNGPGHIGKGDDTNSSGYVTDANPGANGTPMAVEEKANVYLNEITTGRRIRGADALMRGLARRTKPPNRPTPRRPRKMGPNNIGPYI